MAESRAICSWTVCATEPEGEPVSPYKRKRSTLHKGALVFLVVAFCGLALLPYASELVGAYWPELGRRLWCPLSRACSEPSD